MKRQQRLQASRDRESKLALERKRLIEEEGGGRTDGTSQLNRIEASRERFLDLVLHLVGQSVEIARVAPEGGQLERPSGTTARHHGGKSGFLRSTAIAAFISQYQMLSVRRR